MRVRKESAAAKQRRSANGALSEQQRALHMSVRCAECYMVFDSQAARDQHAAAAHLTCRNRSGKLHSRDKLEDRDFEAHTCAICDKVFLAAKSRDQHFRSLHWPDDPVDTSGDWALASEIDADAKSFGYYVCPCKNSWLSAHAFSRSGQQCRKCASVKWLRPYLMWRNDRGAKRGEAQDKMSKPHLRHLCERCCKGLSCTKVDP